MWTILMKIGYSNIYFAPVAFVTLSIEQVPNESNSLGYIFLSNRKSFLFFFFFFLHKCKCHEWRNKFLIDFFSAWTFLSMCILHMKKKTLIFQYVLFVIRTNCQKVIKKKKKTNSPNDWTKCERNRHIKTKASEIK